MEDWLSLPQLSRELGVSDSTARRWVLDFPEYFTSKGHGSGRRFHPAARDVLRRIQTLYAAGLETDLVRETVQKEFVRTIDVDGTDVTALTVQEKQETAILPAVLAFMQQQQEQIESLRSELRFAHERLGEMEEAQKALIDQQEAAAQRLEQIAASQEQRDQRLMEAVEAIRERQNRPWWKFGR